MASIADPTSFKVPGYGRDLARRLGMTGFGHWWARELAVDDAVAAAHSCRTPPRAPVLAFEGAEATLWRPREWPGASGWSRRRASRSTAIRRPLSREAGRARSHHSSARQRHARLKSFSRSRHAPFCASGLRCRRRSKPTCTRRSPTISTVIRRSSPTSSTSTPPSSIAIPFATRCRSSFAARRAIVDPMLRHAESFGARVVGVSVDPPGDRSSSRLDLLPVDRLRARIGLAVAGRPSRPYW